MNINRELWNKLRDNGKITLENVFIQKQQTAHWSRSTDGRATGF